MSNVDIVQRFTNAVENGDRNALQNILADDFRFVHKMMDEPVDKRQFVDMAVALHKGLPDFRFNLSDVKEGNPVKAVAHITATHTGTLHVPPITEEPVSATNKNVELPPEPCTWTIKNDKIVEHTAEKVPGGGPIGILEQIGAPVAKTH